MGPLVQSFGGEQKLTTPGLLASIHTVTLAQVNAGTTIIPRHGNHKLRCVGFIAIPNGAFAALTDIRLSTNEATPVDIAVLAQAQLTDNAVLQPGATGVTLGAGFAVNLTAGYGLQVRKTGSAGTTATDILFIVLWQIVN